MAKKSNEKAGKDRSLNPTIKGLNRIANKIMSYVDPDYENVSDLEGKDLKFQQIINRELDMANGVSHGSIVDFIQAQREPNKKTNDTQGFQSNATPSLFTDNIDQIYNYLVELYDNKYMEMMDLKYICKFIPSLGQAVKITLDHMTASDDIADTIKRSIEFDIEIDKDDRALIMKAITSFEKEHKLLKRLKHNVYKNALTVGTSYVYRIPYKELFENYEAKQKKKSETKHTSMYKGTEGLEGFYQPDPDTEVNYDDELSAATESVTNMINSISNSKAPKDLKDAVSGLVKDTPEEIKDIFESFHLNRDYCLGAAMESVGAYKELSKFSGAFKKSKTQDSSINPANLYPDGAKDPNDIKESSKEIDIEGDYIKYIEGRDIVPLEVFNEVVGYYHVTSKKKKKSRVTAANGGGIFASSMDIANQKKEKAMETIVDSISNMIMKNFNHKFLVENQEFKKIIADCIISKGLADNEYSIQFIPAKYIYAFKINENIDGQGESMLADSMLPGKMLLSYIVSKLVLFVNNTGDKTLVTSHKGPIDVNGKNQLDRAVRQIEGQNITFGDFLSPNVMFNKFNRNSNIMVPTSNNGSKLLEFEKLEGKSMDMGTEMEERLEKMAMIGGGVPDSIMEYNNDLQFSRQVVSSSIKYASFITSLQTDVEDPTTDLYRDLCQSTNLPENLKAICAQHLKVKLPRPRIVTNMNNSDAIRTGKEIAEMIADLYYGLEPEAKDKKAKQDFTLQVCKDLISYFDWEKTEEFKNKSNNTQHGPVKKSEEDMNI